MEPAVGPIDRLASSLESKARLEDVRCKEDVPVVTAEPAKRLRNLRKKLRDIDQLRQKIESGELANPEKEQLEKVARRSEVEAQIADLELELEDEE